MRSNGTAWRWTSTEARSDMTSARRRRAAEGQELEVELERAHSHCIAAARSAEVASLRARMEAVALSVSRCNAMLLSTLGRSPSSPAALRADVMLETVFVPELEDNVNALCARAVAAREAADTTARALYDVAEAAQAGIVLLMRGDAPAEAYQVTAALEQLQGHLVFGRSLQAARRGAHAVLTVRRVEIAARIRRAVCSSCE